MLINICDALLDSAQFVQFEKREKYPWRSVTFGKLAGLAYIVQMVPYWVTHHRYNRFN